MSCRTRLMAVAGTIALFPHLATAQCLNQVDTLATAQGMTTDLPAPADLAGAGGEDAVSELADSGDIVAPPPAGDDMAVLEPSAGAASDSARAQIELLLTAARQAAEAGDENGCLDRLQEATALAAIHGLPTPQ